MMGVMWEWAGQRLMNGKAVVAMIDKLVQDCRCPPGTEHLAMGEMACSVGTPAHGAVCRHLIPGEHEWLMIDILERWIHA